jgi:hypothetical protein
MKSMSDEDTDMKEEYRFDYGQARPNRFAGQIDKSRVVVVLDADVSEVFTTPDEVNAVLRALIATMPSRPAAKSRRRSGSKSAGQAPG